MNVFEDLIEELKEENLLEDTIFELNERSDEDYFSQQLYAAEGVADETAAHDLETNDELALAGQENDEPVVDKAEFYRKLAIDEVTALQMVGQVFSGVEREQMKAVTEAYDDLEAKKALHRFLQVSGDPESDEHLEAKKDLMGETQEWNSALASRDENITVANLRRFCENSRPVLSSQAMLALARFYRNAAYSELARSKFDYIMTRLFSREADGEQRRLLFGRMEMVGHIHTLYANWSSLSVYSSDEYTQIVRDQVAMFSGCATQAEAAETLDDLLNSEVFEISRRSKENMADMFYVPEITAAAIDCNLRIGNKFVTAVQAERDRTEVEALEEKYGDTYDDLITDASGRTIQLIEILRAAPEPEEPIEHHEAEPTVQTFERAPVAEEKSSGLFSVNKWLLAATILISVLSVGVYFAVNSYEDTQKVKSVAADVSVAGTPIDTYVTTARKTKDTLYCVTNAAFENLDEAGQKRVLTDAVGVAETKGATKVHFVNALGRTVAYASPDKVQVYEY
jgi:hypothetical protein